MEHRTTLECIYAEIAHIEDSKEHARLLDMADCYKKELEGIEKTKDQMELAMLTKEMNRFYSLILKVTKGGFT